VGRPAAHDRSPLLTWPAPQSRDRSHPPAKRLGRVRHADDAPTCCDTPASPGWQNDAATLRIKARPSARGPAPGRREVRNSGVALGRVWGWSRGPAAKRYNPRETLAGVAGDAVCGVGTPAIAVASLLDRRSLLMSRPVGGLLAFAIGLSLVEADIRAQDQP